MTKVSEIRSYGRRTVLIKAAQRYETDGWAPEGVSGMGTNTVPYFTVNGSLPIGGDVQHRVAHQAIRDAANEAGIYTSADFMRSKGYRSEVAKTYPSFSALGKLLNSHPKFANWLWAHETALRRAERVSGSRQAFGSGSQRMSDLVPKAYHDSMATLTGTPQRVSAPVK